MKNSSLFRYQLVLGTLLLGIAQAQQQQSATDLLLSKARTLEGRGRADLAAQTWQHILMANPNQPEALAGLARHYKQSGKDAEAQALLTKLRGINPADQAISQIEAIKPVAQPHKARLDEADKLVRAQQYEQAMQIYREVFGDNPPPGGWALAYYETQAALPNGWEAAVSGLQKMAEKYPGASDYRLALGRILTYRPQTRTQGVRMLEALRGKTPYEAKMRQAWRQALVWEGVSKENVPLLRAYLSQYPDAELKKMLNEATQSENKGIAQTKEEQQAYEHLNSGNLDDAEAGFQAVLKGTPQSTAALAGIGFVRMKKGDFVEAIKSFEAAKELAPGDKVVAGSLETARFWQIMRVGNEALTAGQAQEAEEQFQRAVALRPGNADAQIALAGALMQLGRASNAVVIYDRITRSQPSNADAWRHLVNARLQSSGGAAALATVKQIPAQIAASLGKDIEYLTLLVATYSDAGRTDDATAVMKKVTALLSDGKTDLPAPAQLQLAGVFLKQGRSAEALDMYQRVAAMSPENVIAWEGLLAALIQAHKEQEANTAMQRMPKETYAAALRRSGFLHSAALIQAKFGNLATAEALLDKVLKQESADGPQVSTQLLLAKVWADQGHGDKAGKLLLQLIRSNPDVPDVWKSYISALHLAKRDSEALAVGRQIPVSLQQKLENDTDFIGLLAAVCNDAGDYKEAVRLVRSMVARLEAEKQPVPADLVIQLSWLMLDAQEDERALYTVLNSLEARQDLTADQRQRSSEIWSVWTRRRADAARRGGDLARSAEILEAASRVWPNDVPVRSALAGVLIEAGQARRALELFKRWKLTGATPADYAAAIGAAFVERDPIAPLWIQAGLQRWPSDAKLLSLAGQHAAAKGDVKKAEMYWRVALAAMNQAEKNGGTPAGAARMQIAELGAVRQDDPKRSLGRLLVGDSEFPAPTPEHSLATPVRAPQHRLNLPRAIPSESARPEAAGDPTTRISYTGDRERIKEDDSPAPAQLEPIQQLTSGAARFPTAAELSALQTPRSTPPLRTAESSETPVEIQRAYRALQRGSYAVKRETEAISEKDALERQLATLAGRNTPYMGATGTFQTRNGQKGFEQRTLQEVEMTASTTLFDRVRFTAIARPTSISTGVADEGSQLRLGLLPQGAAFGAMNASGLGGEGQISTENFGIRFGASPQGFLVKNYIGGFRFRPAGGPITLLASRDVIKDTFLSYAGVRDPISKQVWGGVVANTFSVLGNWGDEKSGFYVSGGYQTLRGMQVASNKRIDANAGSYWKILTRPEGSLTVGLNLSAMSYDKNLRFFTLGHGGYFSPQKYFLMNVPVHWTGRYKQKFIYGVNASAGTQYVQEDAAPYYPTLPGIQGRTGPTYAAQVLTGGNYNVEALGMYEVTPGWYIGLMADANNARYYTARNVSIFLRHSFGNEAVPGRLGQPSVPDWRGRQPFMLP